MKCAIVQPSFLPWIGFFSLMSYVDIYVVYDIVQYDKRSWRNRNRIRTARGMEWITVPVITKNRFTQTIRDTRIDNTQPWQRKIKRALIVAYGKTPFYYLLHEVLTVFDQKFEYLCDLDVALLTTLMKMLGVSPRIVWASEYTVHASHKIEKLVEVCRSVGAHEYISGPRGRAYIESDNAFTEAGIELHFFEAYNEAYDQIWGPEFMGFLSIVDVIAHCGIEKTRKMLCNYKIS